MTKATEVFVPLKYDHVFREVFSRENVLRHFISDVTGIPIKDIRSVRVTNPFLRRHYRTQKQGILDVLVVLNGSLRVGIEMQLRRQDFWVKRNLFYLSKMYTEDLKAGQDYGRLRRCISISILDFPLEECGEYHRVYTLKDDRGKALTDLLEVHIIELGKELRGSALDEWIRLFNAESMEELEAFEASGAGVREAMEVVRTMNLGRTLRAMYEAHLKAVRDRWAEDEYVRKEGREEGRAEGKAEGMAEGKAESILQLLSLRGSVSEELRERIAGQRDIEMLGEWLLAAARAESVADFREKVGL